MMIGELDFCSGNEQFMRPFGETRRAIHGTIQKKKGASHGTLLRKLAKKLGYI